MLYGDKFLALLTISGAVHRLVGRHLASLARPLPTPSNSNERCGSDFVSAHRRRVVDSIAHAQRGGRDHSSRRARRGPGWRDLAGGAGKNLAVPPGGGADPAPD